MVPLCLGGAWYKLVIHPDCAQAAPFLSEVFLTLFLAGKNEIPKSSGVWNVTWGFQGHHFPVCVRGWKWHPWSRSSQACPPCTAPGCCPSCSFLSKARLSWEDDPVLRADAGILREAQRCRLWAGIPSALQKSRQSLGEGERTGNGVSAGWDVVDGGPGTSFPGGLWTQPVTATLGWSLGGWVGGGRSLSP